MGEEPLLTPEDKARLEEEGKQAAKMVGNALLPVSLSLLTGAPVAWATVLWPLLGALSKLVSPADVALLLKLAVAAGKITALEARVVLVFLQSHAVHPDPRVDPNDPATWGLGAPVLALGPDGSLTLNQEPMDPQKP